MRLRDLLWPWLAALVVLLAAGSLLTVAVLNLRPVSAAGVPAVLAWAPVLVAPALAGAAAVLMLRAPGAGPGEWLQAALPVPALAGAYTVALGAQGQGGARVWSVSVVVVLALVLSAAGGAVLGGRLKQRFARRRGRG